jgi:hypothetical protein
MVPDVLIVSLGTTAGLRRADAELAASLERAGASVEVAAVERPRPARTMALQDLQLARAARRAVRDAGAVIYSTTTAATRAPRPGAIRFDATAAGNRPGRHGIWQRGAERRALRRATLLLPWSAGGLAEVGAPHPPAIVTPVPVEPTGPPPPLAERDLAAVTYGANPRKKGLDRVLAAWRAARRPGETLMVLGTELPEEPGVESRPLLDQAEWRALLRRARAFVTAPRREDYGLAQLEALAEGAQLVTTPAPGPYAALPLARALDPRLVSEDLAFSVRAALDDPRPDAPARAAGAVAPWRPEAVDGVVRDQVLPALLRSGRIGA